MPPEKPIFILSAEKDYSRIPTQSSLADKIIGNRVLRRQVLNDQSEQDFLMGYLTPLQSETPYTQTSFLRTIIMTMGLESGSGVARKFAEENLGYTVAEPEVTDRRTFALAILKHDLITPYIKTFLKFVFRVYLEAIRLQNDTNDPILGSIDTLLEAGEVLAPYTPTLPMKRAAIEIWHKVAEQFSDDKAVDYIYSRINEIMDNMPADSQLNARGKMRRDLIDYAVERLRNQKVHNLSNIDISKLLEVTYFEVEASIGRLNAAGKLEQVRRGLRNASIILDSRVEKLRIEQPELSNYQIAQMLGESLNTVEQSVHRLIAQARIKPKKKR